MFTTGKTVGLAEWIIDNAYIVVRLFRIEIQRVGYLVQPGLVDVSCPCVQMTSFPEATNLISISMGKYSSDVYIFSMKREKAREIQIQGQSQIFL